MTELVVVFADQLSHNLSSLANADKGKATVLMMEVQDEADQVWHHRKKLVFLFSAMRHFADELKEAGWKVRYVKLTDSDNTNNFSEEITSAVIDVTPDRLLFTEPGEWRVEQIIRQLREQLDIPVSMFRNTRFVATKQQFRDWAKGRKELRMEYFYREMRRSTGLLMDGDKPKGGKWNYDQENRSPIKSDQKLPNRHFVEPDDTTLDVLEMVSEKFPDRFGSLDSFGYGVTAKSAEAALDEFIKTRLPDFGTYQDAMITGQTFLFHSVLALYINVGLLDPLKACKAVEKAYLAGNAPINAVEGFIRQIIGWREYVRGVYWLKMPDYLDQNSLDAKEDLPDFYWSGKTKMNCVREVIEQTKEHAYSHHIQRLMITGNFALLAGIDPRQVHEWYLAVYADAFEWVELPNTLGMALFADGGLLASKPYAASANYINKMSNFCKSCHYDPKEKLGERACPFNALYWDFLDRNEKRLGKNPRMGMMYKNLQRMDDKALDDVRSQAQQVKQKLKSGTL